MVPYTPPALNAAAFNCPHCNAYANQHWSPVLHAKYAASITEAVPSFSVAQCRRCEQFSFWVADKMVHPTASPAPLPNPDLPADVKEDYDEARRSLPARSCSAWSTPEIAMLVPWPRVL